MFQRAGKNVRRDGLRLIAAFPQELVDQRPIQQRLVGGNQQIVFANFVGHKQKTRRHWPAGLETFPCD
jgi:hypothetical protein